MGRCPEVFYRYWLGSSVLIFSLRWLSYRFKGHHYLMLEFCYGATLLAAVHVIWFPQHALLRKASTRPPALPPPPLPAAASPRTRRRAALFSGSAAKGCCAALCCAALAASATMLHAVVGCAVLTRAARCPTLCAAQVAFSMMSGPSGLCTIVLLKNLLIFHSFDKMATWMMHWGPSVLAW